jgi:hypothetical protein
VEDEVEEDDEDEEDEEEEAFRELRVLTESERDCAICLFSDVSESSFSVGAFGNNEIMTEESDSTNFVTHLSTSACGSMIRDLPDTEAGVLPPILSF